VTASGWAIAIGLTLAVELFVSWRIMRALNRGSLKVDPLFWLADTLGWDFIADRETNPIVYWGGLLFLVLVDIVVLAVFAAIVVANRH
jgi:hypothetical protein